MVDRVILRYWNALGDLSAVPPLHWLKDWRGEVLISCGNGHLAGLNHEIDAEGNIDPSILCRTPMGDGSECGWHVFARMEGYGDG